VRLMVRMLALAAAMPLPAASDHRIDIVDARIVATAPAQRATAGYMRLRSATATRLLAAESPAAAAVEFHVMSMADGIMRMRQVPAIELPARETVELSPSGVHLMLRDLRQRLRAGDSVELSLTFSAPLGDRRAVQLLVPVVERGR